jgi:UDP-galactopyranose mutase
MAYPLPSSLDLHTDIVVLSHLRWDLVFQRPQQLMTRAAATRRIFYVEEPLPSNETKWHFGIRANGVVVCTPMMPSYATEEAQCKALKGLMDLLIETQMIVAPVLWYYTPMALPSTQHLDRSATVYDCMDELSLFQGAPKGLLELERQLMAVADVMFTGGQALYDHKKTHHGNIHAVPSSIDTAHFGKARLESTREPADQELIPGARFGFFGVIDERMDRDLLRDIAALRPDIHLVMIGPVVKIDPRCLPNAPNIHYLGAKSYDELPAYIAGWNGALMPFALNDSTRFISPTKTPEYLAAGRPVISTGIRDVVFPYAEKGLVHIAHSAPGFVEAMDAVVYTTPRDRSGWMKRVDAHLALGSWDSTWEFMQRALNDVRQQRTENVTA